MPGKFYITTTLPYVNAAPHIGFALEIVAADVLARFQREILENSVIFNSGTDEHGQKIWQKAKEQNMDPQEYCDQYAAKFAQLKDLLLLTYDHFIRTTDPKHTAAAQEFWKRCWKNGDIYKAKYSVKYCIGCELAKTESELVDNRCPLHPDSELEIREEENYFFRFSRYQEALIELYQNNKKFVEPESRLKEILYFCQNGLEDFSISRLKEKMPWGIAVPDDPEHVIYVWFDALINYISTLGWPDQDGEFQFWPGVQIAGKDNLRQQAAMWQAMLLSAGIKNSKKILINGFISVNGQKMSKSLGNAIHPSELVDRYGKDASRFLLMNLGPFGEDMDVSFERLDQEYQAFLANGLGNLASRIAKMAESSKLSLQAFQAQVPENFKKSLESFDIQNGLHFLNREFAALDKELAEKKPWLAQGEEKEEILKEISEKFLNLVLALKIFLPESSQQIFEHFQAGEFVQSFKVGLFPRL